jgi:glycosyltransferase involved in cell wall biosynthesis
MNTIIYVGGFNFDKTNASSIRVIENARFFQNLNFDVKVLGKISLKDNEYSIFIKGVEIFDIEESKNSFAYDITTIKSKVESSVNNIDYIIAYNYPPIAFNKLIKYCASNSIILIPDITEWYGIDGKFTLMKGFRFILNEWRMSMLNKRCHNKIIASSYLQKVYNTSNNLRLPFVTIDKFHFENEIIIDKNNLIFVYAGSPGENFSKDRLDIVIKAFANSKSQHNNFTLNIVGLSKDELLKIDTIRDDIINLDSNLVCFGRVRNEESINIIKKSNLVVFAREINRVSSTGYPTKVFEAFKYGLPVVTNKTSDIALDLNKSNGFIVDNPDINEFSTCINKILSMGIEDLKGIINNCRNCNPFYYLYYKEETISFFKKMIR